MIKIREVITVERVNGSSFLDPHLDLSRSFWPMNEKSPVPLDKSSPILKAETSPPSNNLSPPPEEGMVDDFIANLDLYSPAQLDHVQQKLDTDYMALAEEFTNSRARRADEYLAVIGQLKERCAQERERFNEHLDSMMPDRDPFLHHELPLALTDPGSSKIVFADVPDMEFPIFGECFDKLLAPFNQRLEVLRKKYRYEFDNVELQKHNGVKVIWQQYFSRINEAKNNARREMEEEIARLEKVLYNLTPYQDSHKRSLRNGIVSRKAYYDGLKVAERNYMKLVEQKVRGDEDRLLSPATPEEMENDIYKIEVLQKDQDEKKGKRVYSDFLGQVLEDELKRAKGSSLVSND